MGSRRRGASVLVVDDAPDTLEIVRRNLAGAGYRVTTAPGVPEAISALDDDPVDLVVTDLMMPRIGGLDLVRHVRENLPDTEVMMITGYATVEGAVEAVKTGVEEYLPKPFTDEELLAAVALALERLEQRRAAHPLPAPGAMARYGLLGESGPMRRLFAVIGKAAVAPATVLIQGETGTGKELVARAIHYQSPRSAARFVPVNCGGIPEGLLERELFGHVKGAFTDATESRAGFFQAADGGTLFLDEISETTQAMQVKLLRVLQEREVCRIGDTRPRKVDVRVMAATNKDLLGLVRKGAFREDLFYRLHVVSVEAPPLRDRDSDVGLLACHFASKFARELGRTAPLFSERALDALRGYDWPGNVRELENTVQRAVVMTDGDEIDVPDLPAAMRFTAVRQTGLRRTLAEVELEHIRNVVASVEGNKSAAARVLGIDRKTLRERLKAAG